MGRKIQLDQPTTSDTEITTRIDMAEAKFYEHGNKTDESQNQAINPYSNSQLFSP